MGRSAYPDEVQRVAAAHGLSPALAFGLGEGLNLYYSRRPDERPPHRVHVLPHAFAERVAARLGQPRPAAIRESLVANARGVLVCTGDWHGLDAIERWSEELSRWPRLAGWQTSIDAVVRLLQESDGLYRRHYADFLAIATAEGVAVPEGATRLDEIADAWLAIADRLARGDDLVRVGSRILRMASLESRFWATIIDRYAGGI